VRLQQGLFWLTIFQSGYHCNGDGWLPVGIIEWVTQLPDAEFNFADARDGIL